MQVLQGPPIRSLKVETVEVASQRTVVSMAGEPEPDSFTVACLTVPILMSFLILYVVFDTVTRTRGISKSDGQESVSQLYEDEDGIATEESQKRYSVSIPRWTTLSGAGAGLLTSIAIALLRTLFSGFRAATIDHWLTLGSWVGKHLQANDIANKPA